MARIFVSYARPTLSEARLVAETLRAGGHEVWVDDQLLAHRSFTDAIAEQLDAADAVVVVWSADAARSEWVRAEASRARKAEKLIQIRTERCQLPMPYDQIHCIDLTGWSGDYEAPPWRAVLASIAEVTGIRHGPKTATARRGTVDRRRERRQVTALFCEIANAGPLASRLDPEDMMEAEDAYQAACDDIIAQHGGSIARYVGHGALAYFGYPRGDEEEAAHAVRAGLALRDAAAGLDLPDGGVLRPRVGIATGLVVVSELIGRDQTREAGIVGETPDLAARLASIATPGTVVVAEATRRITEGLFDFRRLEPATPAEGEAPAPAFEALVATDLESRSQARIRRRTTPLFGRERERAQIAEAWAMAQAGEGQVVLVQGEAGIGKSALVDAVRREVADTDGVQVTFSCAPNYSESALHPVAEQFSRAAGLQHGDTAETRREKLAQLLDRYGETGVRSHAVMADLLGIPTPGHSPADALSPEKRKEVTLGTLLALMNAMVEDHPALFVFEDLHWADPTTLELLDRATRVTADRPWLILAVARPEFEARWSDHADVLHIQLGRLSASDAERICLSLGAEGLLSPDTLRQIVARSDGVALYVEEMTQAVLESVAASPVGDAAARVTIPSTLYDSLVARLDRLGSAKPIACLAAAIGRRFSYALLAAVATQPPSELRQSLRELTKSGLVERTGTPPNSHYLFKHALVRDAAYESLLKRQREALHGRIAAVLQEHFPETRSAEPALVAYHLTESGALADAIPLWMEAGQRAAARAAYAEAAAHLRTALDLVRRQPAEESRAALERRLLFDLAACIAGSRGFSDPEVAVVLTEARAICEALGDVRGIATFLSIMDQFATVSGKRDLAEELGHQLDRIADDTGDVALKILSSQHLGYAFWMKADFAGARERLEAGRRLYRDHDGSKMGFATPNDPLVVTLCILSMVLDALGDTARSDGAGVDLIEHARSTGRPLDIGLALGWRALRESLNRNYRRSLSFSTEGLDICRENAVHAVLPLMSIVHFGAAGQFADTDEAIEQTKQSLRAMELGSFMELTGFALGELAALYAVAGDGGAALSTIDQAIIRTAEVGDDVFLSPLHLRRAEILARFPGADRGAADTAFRRALAIAEAQGAPGFAARARTFLAPAAPQA